VEETVVAKTELYIHAFPDAPTMPIPPVAEHMETFKAGAITIGVEYRILTDALLAAMGRKASAELGSLDDTGVSLHVYAKAEDGDLERLRFDCFKNDPHYHYISWPQKRNDHVFFDPNLHGDLLAWSLDLIRTRLPQMLEKTGVADAAQIVDQRSLEEVLPLVTESAYRARYHANSETIAKGAIADGQRLRA
jgi:hypothetical protein